MKSSGIDYWSESHAYVPHIVKFSGGRSSAMLLLLLAENNMLKPERGDVVLFANTSAEHTGTYKFAADVSRYIETNHEIPVFWYEFCTVEDASRGNRYTRSQTYRLVSKKPIETDPNGFSHNGEVFEEMLSYQKILPTPLQRSCTAKLKLFPGHSLLDEWIAGADGPSHAGHYSENSYIDASRNLEMYRQNGGQMPDDQYMSVSEYLLSRPPSRQSQKWSDFTDAPIKLPEWSTYYNHGMFGIVPSVFVTFLGLRHDERKRINRILSRTIFAEGAGSSKCRIKTQPPGELPYFPLDQWGAKKDNVIDYWKKSDKNFGVKDLDIPEDAGNCVYCFMKGTSSLQALSESMENKTTLFSFMTPEDIEWWNSMEKKYGRKAPARNGDGETEFGFFGSRDVSYEAIAAKSVKQGRYSKHDVSCDCTD